jgi:hypothetical protein
LLSYILTGCVGLKGEKKHRTECKGTPACAPHPANGVRNGQPKGQDTGQADHGDSQSEDPDSALYFFCCVHLATTWVNLQMRQQSKPVVYGEYVVLRRSWLTFKAHLQYFHTS